MDKKEVTALLLLLLLQPFFSPVFPYKSGVEENIPRKIREIRERRGRRICRKTRAAELKSYPPQRLEIFWVLVERK